MVRLRQPDLKGHVRRSSRPQLKSELMNFLMNLSNELPSNFALKAFLSLISSISGIHLDHV